MTIVIDFEDKTATVTPPFVTRPGGLTTTAGITRGDIPFDIVTNIGEQTKPPEFGLQSLDPFFNQGDPTPFTLDLGTGERGYLANNVSITMGDYGEDIDDLTIKLFDDNGIQIGAGSDILLPAADGSFTAKTLTVPSEGGQRIRKIQFIGGHPNFPNSVIYDNITLTYTPTTNDLSCNPYWGENVGKDVANQITKALNGQQPDQFVFLASSSNCGDEPPSDLSDPPPEQKGCRDETTTAAAEAYKIGSPEWLEAVKNYWYGQNTLSGLAKAAAIDVFSRFGPAWDMFIAMLQTADLAVKVCAQTGLSPFDPGVLIAAGIQPFGNLAGDAIIDRFTEKVKNKVGKNIKDPVLKSATEAQIDQAADQLKKDWKLGDSIINGINNRLNPPGGTPQSQQSSDHHHSLNDKTQPLAKDSSVDKVVTRAQSERIQGSSKNDKLSGTIEDNFLFGKAGNDILRGKQGWDTLIGDIGNDRLVGAEGADMLNGCGKKFVEGEVDRLAGGEGVDIFVLGDPNRIYYNDRNRRTAGTKDFAVIQDFNFNQDFIVLKGEIDDYVFKGNKIFLDNDGKKGLSRNDELIAKLNGAANLGAIDIMFV